MESVAELIMKPSGTVSNISRNFYATDRFVMDYSETNGSLNVLKLKFSSWGNKIKQDV